MPILHIRDGFPEQRQIILSEKKQRICSSVPYVESLMITHIGHFPKTNYHFVERTAGAKEHILIVNLSGRGWIRIKNKLWQIPQDAVVCIPANVPHAYGADESIPWNIYWMHLSGSQADAFMAWKEKIVPEPVVELSSVDRIIELFETAIRYTIADYNDVTLAKLVQHTSAILAEIICSRVQSQSRGKKVEGRIIRSIQLMQESVNEDLALETLAQKSGLSVPHYCLLFKQHTGTTPLRFFTRLRLQRACELMQDSDKNLMTIAYELGFSDPFYFGRVFKKMMGMTASAYRKQLNVEG